MFIYLCVHLHTYTHGSQEWQLLVIRYPSKSAQNPEIEK